MHYVKLDGTPLDAATAATVVRIPKGISDRFPLGGFFTEDGVQVTALKDGADHPFGAPLQGQTASTAFTKVDLIQELRDQLNRIEAAQRQAL